MREIEKPFGPVYNVDSTALARHRRRARAAGSVSSMSREERIAYADAVEAAIRSRVVKSAPVIRPRCASGTWHSDGEDIARAIRGQHQRMVLAEIGHSHFQGRPLFLSTPQI